ALLLESDEIKKYKPLFNRAQRRSRFHYGIFSKKDRKGYIQFYVERTKTQKKAALYVTERSEGARRALYNKAQEFQLCLKLCGLYETKSACFGYQVKECQGACIQEEGPESYNERAQAAMDTFNRFARKSFMVITRGRESGEKALVCVENGRYLGYGYMDAQTPISNLEEAKSYIQRFKDNKDIHKILWGWLKKHPKDAYLFSEAPQTWDDEE
ncbi:MAG: DNA polymerase III subunit epsilon, partial [Bacteroidota bacterium]